MNLFSYLKTRIAILDVAGEFTTLKKAGLYWKGQCPFHSEKTASFTVSPHKEIFYCFGCHVGGDVIAFMARMEHCSQMEAAKYLIDRYQVEVPSTLAADAAKSIDEGKHYFHVCHTVAQWCHAQLLQSDSALAYLAERRISTQSINTYMLGYFPGGLAQMRRFTADLAKQNILTKDLLDAHILSQGKNILFSPFEERIIFPIADHLGRYCGFGGRIFKPNDTRPKYYNSHENDHFLKGHLLFGLDKAKKEIQKTETVFLVEGYTDCIAMAQYGHINTVATLGTACTVDHLTTLSRYAQQLYVVYDGDNAGQQAILRIGQMAWQASMELKVLHLPAKEDPASYLGKGLSLKPLISDAPDIFSFFIQTLGNGFATKPLGAKLELARKIIEMIQKLDDPLKQDILLKNASLQLEIPFESLKKELVSRGKRPVAKPLPEPPRAATLPEPPSQEIGPLENKIFFSIMNNIQLINKENEEFLISYLPQPLCDILKKLREEKQKVPNLGFIQFFESLDEHNQTYVSKTLLAQNDGSSGLFEQLFVQLQKKHWKVIVNSIKMKLEAAKKAGDDAQIAQIMSDFADLKKKIIGKMVP